MTRIAERQQIEQLMAGPAAFRERLLIDADDGAKLLGLNLHPFQADDFAPIDLASRRVVGQDVEGKSENLPGASTRAFQDDEHRGLCQLAFICLTSKAQRRVLCC